jgi:HD superfamily phosphohydrolase
MSKRREPGKRAERSHTPIISPLDVLARDGLPPTEPLAEETAVVGIRDSLYDMVPLGALERDLINTAAFLRLQQIRQLGFVYRVWPGATHTRYEHSLGVYYLALRALRLLAQRRTAGLRLTPAEKTTQPERVLLAAALLHDIGHYPFSHAIEELGFPIVSHEQVGRAIITSGEVAKVLRTHGLAPEIVANLIDLPRGQEHQGVMRVLAKLLSGALDVDKLDYLPRDARACNVPYGGVDVTRLLGALRVEDQGVTARLAVDAKGISPLNSLVHARQEMFDNIYWHHTGRAMICMLLRAVQEALLAGAIKPGDLVGHDDASLLAFLGGETMPPATRALVEGLHSRRAYKVVVELSSRAGRLYQQINALYWDAAKRRRAELALAEDLSAALGEPVPDWGILIDIPKPEKWEMDVTVIFDDPPLGMQRVMTWAEATGQTADDLSRYETHQRRVRLVASPELRDAAQLHRETLLARLEQLAVL